MANSNLREASTWATHRARTVRNILIGLGGLAVVLLFANPAEDTDTTAAQPDPFSTPSVVADPKVAAPVSNPMNPYQGANDTLGQNEAGSTATADPALYQDMLGVAQSAAVSFGTYSYEQTAQEWAALITDATPDLAASLAAGAEGTWSQIVDQQVVSVARLVGTTPQIVYYRDADGAAQVLVSVSRSITSADTAAQSAVTSYAITLARVVEGAPTGDDTLTGTDAAPQDTPTEVESPSDAADDSTARWVVTGIASD